MMQKLRALTALLQDMGSLSNRLKLQAQGLCHPLLALLDTRPVCDADTDANKTSTHTHKISEKEKNKVK